MKKRFVKKIPWGFFGMLLSFSWLFWTILNVFSGLYSLLTPSEQ